MGKTEMKSVKVRVNKKERQDLNHSIQLTRMIYVFDRTEPKLKSHEARTPTHVTIISKLHDCAYTALL